MVGGKSPTRITVALAGNPNSGKTTLFNAITGLRQHVANYPGVTVETHEGLAEHGGLAMRVVDLPGTYSLSAYSAEELVARRFILDDKPDVVVSVVDCSNLERNLYLATQLLELGCPLVLAFNMADLADARGFHIHVRKLSQLLGVGIVRTIGHKGIGVDRLLDEVVRVAAAGKAAAAAQSRPNYGEEIEPHVRQLADRIAACAPPADPRWLAVKLLENDAPTAERLARACPEGFAEIAAEADRLRRHIEGVFGDSCEMILADRRYGFISGACTEAVTQNPQRRHEISDQIDKVVTHRLLGLPIFAVMMYLAFQVTFWIGGPLTGLLEAGKERLADAARGLATAGIGKLLASLLADGIIEGVGAVLTYVPVIAMLYFAVAILEDSGYMARAAFVLDRLMHRIGLHGKSFIPMLIGFGCTVPAVLATRVLETRRDRLTTMMVLPLFSCGARLPIYILILGAFFPSRVVLGLIHTGTGPRGQPTYLLSLTNQAMGLFAIYALGVVLAVLCAAVLRKTILRGEVAPLVMELPPYRMPAWRGLAIHTWERTWMFLRKAGTIILGASVVLWALKTWPALDAREAARFDAERAALRAEAALPAEQIRQKMQGIHLREHWAEITHSAIGRIGRGLAPVLKPCGFDWKISTSLLGSLAAKEAFISQLGILYAVPEHVEGGSATLGQKIAADYSPLQGVCMMIFLLIASPCAATFVVTLRESGRWKWALFQWTYLTALAWFLATATFQVGRLAGG